MAIDLSALDASLEDAPATAAPAKSTGEPLHIELSLVDEDPDQPRKEFSAEAMADMVTSIKARGVKSPVSVRPHPKKKGRWMLNFGARRYRASIEAGNATIPAFVDEAHDDFDQVIENLQRENLSPMEMALFIKRKLADGETAAKIAKKLGKPAITVTEHMSLIDAPACIEEVYANGKSRSPKTLHELRKLHGKHPEQVEGWCGEVEEVTRRTVAELADSLSGRKKGGGNKALNDQDAAENLSHDLGGAAGGNDGSEAGTQANGNEPADVELPYHNAEHEKQKQEPKVDDPSKIKKPVLLVEFDGRAAMVMLNRRPSTPGLIHIKYEDNGEEVEVDGGRCKINCLIESTA